MTRGRIGVYVGVVVVIGFAIAGVVTHTRAGDRIEVLEARVLRFERFCRDTSFYIGTDRRSFESNNPDLQEVALAQFFYSNVIHHGRESIAMCLDGVEPAAPPSHCLISKDWDCLAGVAAKIEQHRAKMRGRFW